MENDYLPAGQSLVYAQDGVREKVTHLGYSGVTNSGKNTIAA